MNHKTNRTAWESNEYSPDPRSRVLLVDDDAPIREVLNELLQQWSYATSLAANVSDARHAVLTEEPFTIIVCDYHLPDGTGLEFRDWLRRTLPEPVPFLLISGGLAGEVTADYEFLAKPFRMQDLRIRLERLSRVHLQPKETFGLSTAQEAMASVYARHQPPKAK